MPIDTGSTAFMLTSAALVLFMTPGLAFFYGGLEDRKSVLTMMMQSFISMAWVGILWFVAGYSLTFGGFGNNGVVGDLSKVFLIGVKPSDIWLQTGVPEYVIFVYQMMFAIITPALITGAFAKRVRFPAWIMILTAWHFLIYVPFAHMIWGGGWLAQWGVLDFAGGISVHNTAGFASIAAVVFLGKRKRVIEEPHNIPFIALGVGMLWFGWFGFNAGSELKVDEVTALAFVNTMLGAIFGGAAWAIMDRIFKGHMTFIGMLVGFVAGLATVTATAGFIPAWSASIVGIVAGVGCYLAIMLKNKIGFDDALDVWGCHGMGGFYGIFMLGIFATKAVNGAGADGLITGHFDFFLKECAVIAISSIWSFAVTYAIFFVVNLISKVRPDAEAEENIDEALIHEMAYEAA